jgi:ubiquinone/menaquinone biosynthesis C-methylase UbiE
MELHVSLHRGLEHPTRLRLLSGVKWSSPEQSLVRAGLKSGMRCLDVRCGSGQATLPMARLAGASGAVLGIDPEERLLVQAREEAAKQGLRAEFRSGDIADLDAPGTFDLAYSRFLLSLRPREQAEKAIRQMIRAVQPGGIIVLEDLECLGRVEAAEVDNPAYKRFLELYMALMREDEGEPSPGLQLPRLLEQIGIAGVQCSNTSTSLESSEHARNPAAQFLDSIRHAIVAAHLATRTEVKRLTTELDKFRMAPQNLFWMPRIVQVWGSVPSVSSGL